MKKIMNEWRSFLKEQIDRKKKIYVLVGPPSVGKSTWIKQNADNSYVISSDEKTIEVARERGMTYDDMFIYPPQPLNRDKTPNKSFDPSFVHPVWGPIVDQQLSWKKWMPKAYKKVNDAEVEAQKRLDYQYANATSAGKDIVLDLTNMHKGSRKFAIQKLGDISNFDMIAINFDWNDDVDYLKRTAAERSKKEFEDTGMKKTIPDAAFDRMVGGYERPDSDEGFESIKDVKAWWAK